ncbi:MAG: lasso peptide isopeptide bond-forming cyclase [Elainella sp. Prado103]|nr:lasso peptide isopeptide bond-forming cyclase [Elainella sp. Prado103]
MSGIIGIFHLDDRPVHSADLQRMSLLLSHRGSDGDHLWLDGAIGLGHRMLWTTPESLLEKLPLVQGCHVLTADARIDNREELIAAFGWNQRPTEKITDSDLILAAYRQWGDQCPAQLLGDFVFAIWDGNQQRLFCARDHFGVKPFYYYFSGKSFIFASEIKAIVGLPEVPCCLNEPRIADHLFGLSQDKTATSYQHIFRLPPAHTLVVNAVSGLQLKPYWSIDRSAQIRLGSDQEYAEAFREIFIESVRCRLRSAFPIGSHLSGGLDSSSVTCVARDLLSATHTPLHTFSNVFDEVPECDERPFIQPVLDQGGCIAHPVHPDRSGPLSAWQEVFQYEDEALFGANSFLVWGLNQATQQAGVRVILNGFDGDSTVSHGELYLSELARQGDWATFAAETTAILNHLRGTPLGVFRQYGQWQLEEWARKGAWLKLIQAIQQIHQHFQISRKFLLWHGSLKPIVADMVQSLRCWGQGVKPSLLDPCIQADFAQRLHLSEKLQALTTLTSPPARTVQEEQWQTFEAGLFTLTLELINIHAAACSIEARHPFMDKRLIEFCLAIPATQKLQQGWTRMIMRRAMEGILPAQIQWRARKTSMSANFRHGLLHHDRHLVEDVLENGSGRIASYVNLDVVRGYWQQFVSGGKIDDHHVMTLWKTVILARWLNHTGLMP